MKTFKFKQKARKVHKEWYSYKDTEYVSARTPVAVRCKIHGDFTISPNNHLNGAGCRKCSQKAKDNNHRKVLVGQVVIHTNSSTPILSTILGITKPMEAVCPMHGKYSQELRRFLKTGQCPKCSAIIGGSKQISSTKEFISKAIVLHGNVYSYTKTVYTTAKSKVVVTCGLHGDFTKTPNKHLQGQGCPRCNVSYHDLDYFSNNLVDAYDIGILYLVKMYSPVTKEVFYKIGVSKRSVDRRFTDIKGYIVSEVSSIHTYRAHTYLVEQYLHKLNANNRYTPKYKFVGFTECFLTKPMFPKDGNEFKQCVEKAVQ